MMALFQKLKLSDAVVRFSWLKESSCFSNLSVHDQSKKNNAEESPPASHLGLLVKAAPRESIYISLTWMVSHGRHYFQTTLENTGHLLGTLLSQAQLDAIVRKEREQILAIQLESVAAIPRRKKDIPRVEKNGSLTVSLGWNEYSEKHCSYAVFPVEFHREMRIVPLCVLGSSQACCLCSPSNERGPSAI